MVQESSRSNGSASLQVFDGETLVFESNGRWLHPLFELERFLERSDDETAKLRIQDKIIGKAAAFLIVRLGFRQAYGTRMSRLGEHVFRSHGVSYSFAELVDRIDCATEALLERVEGVDEAYRLVKECAMTGASPKPRTE